MKVGLTPRAVDLPPPPFTLLHQAERHRSAGASAHLLPQHVPSLAALRASVSPRYHAVVVCAGAALGALEDAAAPASPVSAAAGLLSLVRGAILELGPRPDCASAAAAFPPTSASLLGETYVAALGPGRMLLGATKERGISPQDAARQLGQPATGADADAAWASLQPAADALVPRLAAAWRVASARVGVRAMPPNTTSGKVRAARAGTGAQLPVGGGRASAPPLTPAASTPPPPLPPPLAGPPGRPHPPRVSRGRAARVAICGPGDARPRPSFMARGEGRGCRAGG